MSTLGGIKALFEDRRFLSRLARPESVAYADRLIRQSHDALTESYCAIGKANRIIAKGLPEPVESDVDSARDGRFVRVGKYRGHVGGIFYIVAIADPAQALELIRVQASVPGDDVEDLGRLGCGLLAALKLATGQFALAWAESAAR